MFEKIWSNIKGEAKLAFGMSDTGQIRVNEKGQLEFDTCFVAGTLIRTKEGYTAIDKLKVGDYVLSHNEKTGLLSYNKITETFIHDVPAIYKITYTNGTEVETTWNHPFYIKGQGWTKAKLLNPEQRSVTVSSIRNAAILREMSSSPQMGISLAALSNEATATPWNDLYEGTAGIAKIERVIRQEKVYNIEVEGDHSYFVTRAGLLVHNYEVNPKLELLPSNDVKGLTTVNKEPKYQKLTMDGRTYEKVVDGKGNVSFESKLTNGERVVLQVTPEGMIKRTTHSPSESKLWGMIKMSPKTTTEYLNPSGEVLGHDAVVRI
ncbi:Hint domain-containing protein, partial [Leptospira saintgironsiae]|uniref:Hint domain-containing protein n=1 Tax=Leptospira saintgironsiae TaxID=2023183 RepID=UPI001FCBDE9F